MRFFYDLDPFAISLLILFLYQIIYQRADWIYPTCTFLCIMIEGLLKLFAKMDQRLKNVEFGLSLVPIRVTPLRPLSPSLLTPNVGTAAAPDERSAPGCR